MAVQKTDNPITALQECYRRFWEGFNLYTKDNSAFCKEFNVHPYPSIRPYQDYHIGKPFHITVGVDFKNSEIRVGAYFKNMDSYDFWSQQGKRRLESFMDRQLIWKRFKTAGSIFTYETANFSEEHGWENAFIVMVDTMIKMKKAFIEGVK